MNWPEEKKVLAVCGGVGGAKLALGLTKILRPAQLSLVINTADDFEHLGLTICPDLDTVVYTLAQINNKQTGWGRADEHWHCMETLEQLGGETWFRLGDRDLATHLLRRSLLDQGITLSEATTSLCQRLGIAHPVFPMSDERVVTEVKTAGGWLEFQRYFVEQQCAPAISAIRFVGADQARPSPGLSAALQDQHLGAVIICPSNPFLSIDPLLAIPGVRDRLSNLNVPVIAVSPVIAGKGPTAKIMRELSLQVTPATVVAHYRDFLSGFVLDQQDQAYRDALQQQLPIHLCNTLMRSLEDRMALAQQCLSFSQHIAELP